MDYGPAGRRQKGSDCGQDVDLQKGLNQLNSSSGPNLDITASGMPVLPLTPTLLGHVLAKYLILPLFYHGLLYLFAYISVSPDRL